MSWLCQHVHGEIRDNRNLSPPKSKEQTLESINNSLFHHNRGTKTSRFDDDIFDAVRTDDLRMMVGAWCEPRVEPPAARARAHLLARAARVGSW